MTNETDFDGHDFEPTPTSRTVTTAMQLENADAIRWARHSLRIDDADAASSTADLLRRVTEWEYVIPPDAVDAVQLLANPEGLAPGSRGMELAARRGSELRREREVTDFAGVFFDLAPGQRTPRWQALRDECRDDRKLTRWLDDLAPGLDVAVPPTSTNERFNRLVTECCQTFVMRRPASIRRRQEFLAECHSDRVLWEMTARELKSRHPLFVGQIATWVRTLAQLRAADRDQQARFEQLLRQTPIHEQPMPILEVESRPLSWWWFVFAVMILVRLVGVLVLPVSQAHKPGRSGTPVVIQPLHRSPPTSQPSPRKDGTPPASVEQLLQQNPELQKLLQDNTRKDDNDKRPPESGF